MSLTRSSIWCKEFELGPVQAAVIFAVIGAVVGVLFSQMDASWPLHVTIQVVLWSGLGANCSQHRIRSAAVQKCSTAKSLLCFTILVALLFAPIMCLWGSRTILTVLAFFGGFSGLTICCIGHWHLLRRLFSLLRRRAGPDNPENRSMPHD